jgi:hypothetical protein
MIAGCISKRLPFEVKGLTVAGVNVTGVFPDRHAHVPAKLALGLDPWVATGSPIRTCAILVEELS